MKTLLFVFSPVRVVSTETLVEDSKRLKGILKINKNKQYVVRYDVKNRIISVGIVGKNWKLENTDREEKKMWEIEFYGYSLRSVKVVYANAYIPSTVRLVSGKNSGLADINMDDLSGGIKVSHNYLPGKQKITISTEILKKRDRLKHQDKMAVILDELERKIKLTDLITDVLNNHSDPIAFELAMYELYHGVNLISKRDLD